ELDDLLLAVERVLAPNVDVAAGELDHVVTGPCLAAQAQRGDRARVDDEQILEPPGVRHVLVPGEDEVHARPLEAFDRVARVVDDVTLPPGAGYRQQVVVADEHAQVGRSGEALIGPAVRTAAELPMVKLRTGRSDSLPGNLS